MNGKNYKSKISKGAIFDASTVDKRTKSGRRWRDLFNEFANTLGGADTLSTPVLLEIRRAATLSVQLELLDAEVAAGEDINAREYAYITSTLSGCLQRLGLVGGKLKRSTSEIRRRYGLDDVCA